MPNNNIIFWRNHIKKLRLRQVIIQFRLKYYLLECMVCFCSYFRHGYISMWLLPEFPFLIIRICVVIRSLMVLVWLITPTFLPCEVCSIASESMTMASVSGSSVPKPSSINRFSNEIFREDRDESPRASPRLTMNVSPPDKEVVSRTSSARSWSMTRMPSEFFTCCSS